MQVEINIFAFFDCIIFLDYFCFKLFIFPTHRLAAQMGMEGSSSADAWLFSDKQKVVP